MEVQRRAWTKEEVDGLVFRLLKKAYRTDNKTCRFLNAHLHAELLRELT